MNRDTTDCRNCGEDVSRTRAGSLPVDNNGDIVAIDYKGPWSGVPACATCVDLHRAAGAKGPAVLDVYERVQRQRRDDMEQVLAAMKEVRERLEGLPL